MKKKLKKIYFEVFKKRMLRDWKKKHAMSFFLRTVKNARYGRRLHSLFPKVPSPEGRKTKQNKTQILAYKSPGQQPLRLDFSSQRILSAESVNCTSTLRMLGSSVPPGWKYFRPNKFTAVVARAHEGGASTIKYRWKRIFPLSAAQVTLPLRTEVTVGSGNSYRWE